MVTHPRKREKVDLEKIAAQLASIKLLALAEENQLTLRAIAKFTTRSFAAGKYKVSVGIRQALFHLDHPSFEVENAYQATLPKETWSQSWNRLNATHAEGKAKLNFGAKVLSLLGVNVEGEIGKNTNQSAEQMATTPYRIVTAVPMGWQIGSELGDPRSPDGSLPEGLEHCLNGEYLSGRNDEHGDGMKDKTGAIALCTLKPKMGGNDPRIVATLFAASGSLTIAIALAADPADAPQPVLQAQISMKEHEDSLRRAFVEICLERASAVHRQGIRTDEMLSGELYLSHHEIHAPKIAERAASDVLTEINVPKEQNYLTKREE